MSGVELEGFTPGFHMYTFDKGVESFEAKLEDLRGRKYRTGVFRGGHCLTVPTFYDEFVSSFGIISAFGRNWNAFDDLFTDLEYVDGAPGVVIGVYDVDLLLNSEPDEEIGWFVDSMDHSYTVWGEPIQHGDIFDRPSMTFHAVLCAGDDIVEGFRRRLENGGRTVEFHPFNL